MSSSRPLDLVPSWVFDDTGRDPLPTFKPPTFARPVDHAFSTEFWSPRTPSVSSSSAGSRATSFLYVPTRDHHPEGAASQLAGLVFTTVFPSPNASKSSLNPTGMASSFLDLFDPIPTKGSASAVVPSGDSETAPSSAAAVGPLRGGTTTTTTRLSPAGAGLTGHDAHGVSERARRVKRYVPWWKEKIQKYLSFRERGDDDEDNKDQPEDTRPARGILFDVIFFGR